MQTIGGRQGKTDGRLFQRRHCLWHPEVYFRWGDGTSRNDVSPYECSGTPGPQINRTLWHNIPGLTHPCYFDHIYVLYHAYNDRDVSIQGHCVSGTIDLGDQGSQNIRTGTHRFGTSRHPTIFQLFPEYTVPHILLLSFGISKNWKIKNLSLIHELDLRSSLTICIKTIHWLQLFPGYQHWGWIPHVH